MFALHNLLKISTQRIKQIVQWGSKNRTSKYKNYLNDGLLPVPNSNDLLLRRSYHDLNSRQNVKTKYLLLKWWSEQQPFACQIRLNHSNTRLVHYSYPNNTYIVNYKVKIVIDLHIRIKLEMKLHLTYLKKLHLLSTAVICPTY